MHVLQNVLSATEMRVTHDVIMFGQIQQISEFCSIQLWINIYLDGYKPSSLPRIHFYKGNTTYNL